MCGISPNEGPLSLLLAPAPAHAKTAHTATSTTEIPLPAIASRAERIAGLALSLRPWTILQFFCYRSLAPENDRQGLRLALPGRRDAKRVVACFSRFHRKYQGELCVTGFHMLCPARN